MAEGEALINFLRSLLNADALRDAEALVFATGGAFVASAMSSCQKNNQIFGFTVKPLINSFVTNTKAGQIDRNPACNLFWGPSLL